MPSSVTLTLRRFDEGAEFEVRQEFAREIEPRADGILRVAFLVARFGIEPRAQREARVEEPRIDVEHFAAHPALRVVDCEEERASVAEEIAIAEAHADGHAFVAARAEGEADLARLGLRGREVEPQLVDPSWASAKGAGFQTGPCAASRGRFRRASRGRKPRRAGGRSASAESRRASAGAGFRCAPSVSRSGRADRA